MCLYFVVIVVVPSNSGVRKEADGSRNEVELIIFSCIFLPLTLTLLLLHFLSKVERRVRSGDPNDAGNEWNG